MEKLQNVLNRTPLRKNKKAVSTAVIDFSCRLEFLKAALDSKEKTKQKAT